MNSEFKVRGGGGVPSKNCSESKEKQPSSSVVQQNVMNGVGD